MNDRELFVIEVMEKYGGGFVKALANAFRHADIYNFEKLKKAFPEYWVRYEKMVGNTAAEIARQTDS